MIEYAYNPALFHERADDVVKQLFDADGLLRELTPMRVGTSTEIIVRNESIFVGIVNVYIFS